MLFATSAAIGLPGDGCHPHKQRGEGRACSLRKLKSKWKGGRVGKHTNHNDRDSLPTVAHSIRYSWKCVTFPPNGWLSLQKPFYLDALIVQFRGNVTARAQLLPHLVPSEAGWPQKVILRPCHVCVIKLNVALFSWLIHDTAPGVLKHNPPT